MERTFNLGAVVRGVSVAVATGACVTPYRTPASSEPHAIVTFRRTYLRTAGESLTEWLLVDGKTAFDRVSWSGEVHGPLVDTLRVRPIQSRFTAKMLFAHSEMRPVTDTFYEQVPELRTESFNCATGTCTREVTDYRTVPRTRYVSHYLDVADATCAKDVRFEPLVNHSYLLQLTYQQHGACSLSCSEQVATAEGQVRDLPCGGDSTPETGRPHDADKR